MIVAGTRGPWCASSTASQCGRPSARRVSATATCSWAQNPARHLDYLHDGDAHRAHDDHVDAEPASNAPAHLAHVGHMHAHREGCGHPAIPHGDHLDYVHGTHRHSGHQVHYDEH